MAAAAVLSLLAVSVLVSACGQGTAPGHIAAPKASAPRAGLEAALRSGQAELIAETLSELMALQGQTSIDAHALVAEIRRLPDGPQLIASASGLLRRKIEEADREALQPSALAERRSTRRSSHLIALMALNPTPAERERFLRGFNAAETAPEGAAAAEAAYFAEPDPRRWPQIIADAGVGSRSALMTMAVRRRLAMPAAPLAAALDRWVGPSLNWRDLTERGLALRLLELANVEPPASAGDRPDRAIALAAAAVQMEDTATVEALLLEAGSGPLTDAQTDRWFEVLALALFSKPSTLTRLKATAERLAASNPEPRLPALGLLRSSAYSDLAETLIRRMARDEASRETGSAALGYLGRQGAWRRALEVRCSSADGAAEVLPPEVSVQAPPPEIFDSWAYVLAEIPPDEIRIFIQTTLRVQPRSLRTRCLRELISGRQDAREIAASLVASDPALLEFVRNVPRLTGIGIEAQYAFPPPCLRLTEALQRPGPGQDAARRQTVAFALVCRTQARNLGSGSKLPIPFAILLEGNASPQLAALIAPSAVWGNFIRSEDALENFVTSDSWDVWSRLADGRFDAGMLNHSELLWPLLIGRNPQENFPEAVGQGAARLLILRGDDPALVRWLVARLANYRSADAQQVGAGLSVLRRSWEAVGAAAQRRREADAAMGTASPEVAQDLERKQAALRRRISDEIATLLDACRARRADPAAPAAASQGESRVCIGDAAADARFLSGEMDKAGFSSLSDAIDRQLSAESSAGWTRTILLALGLHLLVWIGLFLAYPRSPTIQASVFWNPWVRKYLGLGYVQLLLLTVPPLTRRLLAPFRGAFAADGQLESFRRDIYFNEIRGRRYRAAGTQTAPMDEILPGLDDKLWLQAPSGSGKTWFLRELAGRSRRPLIFLNATSCTGGVTAALRERTAGWVAESDFLDQLIYSGRIAVIVDGLNEVAPEIRSAIVVYANRFPKGRILLATQPTRTPPPNNAERVEMLPLDRDQIGEFLLGRAEEVLKPDADRALFAERVAAFLGSIDEGTPEERDALLHFISNPMDLRLVADLLADGVTPNLLRLQQQQIARVEEDYLAANGSPFPVIAFAEHLYLLRCDNKSLTLAEDSWPAEREVLRQRRLVLREDAPEGGNRWRFRHDKITDYFLFRAFQACPARFNDHLADNRFIGVYVLLARHLSREDAHKMLSQIYWQGAKTEDFTIGKAFQDALEQKLALQSVLDSAA